jgi:hypothetical protein
VLFHGVPDERLGCSCGFEQRHDGCSLHVGRGDALEVRANTAQLGIYKSVYKTKSAIKPCEQAILDSVMDRESDFGAAWPNFGKVDQSQHVDVAARRFEGELVDRIAVHRQEDRARFKTERTAKTEVHRFRRSHGRLGDHDKLALVRLNTGQPGLGFGQRLTHVKRFFKEHM